MKSASAPVFTARVLVGVKNVLYSEIIYEHIISTCYTIFWFASIGEASFVIQKEALHVSWEYKKTKTCWIHSIVFMDTNLPGKDMFIDIDRTVKVTDDNWQWCNFFLKSAAIHVLLNMMGYKNYVAQWHSLVQNCSWSALLNWVARHVTPITCCPTWACLTWTCKKQLHVCVFLAYAHNIAVPHTLLWNVRSTFSWHTPLSSSDKLHYTS